MATQIKLRRDTAANWLLEDPVLGQGEPGFETNTGKLKIGDGTSLWSALDYIVAEPDGSIDLSAVDQHIIPATDNTYDLGSPAKRWKHGYFATGSLYVGDIKISNSSGTLVVQQVTNAGELTEAPVANPGVVTTDRIINGEHEFSINADGALQLDGAPYTGSGTGLPTNTLGYLYNDGTGTLSWTSGAGGGTSNKLANNGLEVVLGTDGTLTTPLLLPATFTATCDPAHFGDLTLTGDAWYFEIQFQVNPNGTVQTMIGNNTPWPNNPGYSDGMMFAFTEADHGIPGYTFTLTLVDIQNPGPAGWTTNLTASVPPEYPSTISSIGAIKLTADTSGWVFGTDGALSVTSGNLKLDNQVETGSAIMWNTGTGAVINNVPMDNYFVIATNTDVGTPHYWKFGTDGNLRIPVGGDIQDSNGNTVLGGGTPGAIAQGAYELSIDTNGNLQYPGAITQSYQRGTSCPATVDTVVYTSTGQFQHGIKLFVMVEGFTDGGGGSWDTQACDVIAVKGYNDNIVHVTTYGVTYSGATAIATFDGQWNATTSRIEITCRPVSVTNGVTVSVHAIEINSVD